jgi:radical SAM superfamily enzyme with C-terminal helix-hairpin-helix motif
MALGLESLDPSVIAMNGLKVSPEEARGVVEMINGIGGRRIGGIPVILPGINLVQGLRGETAETFAMNYRWLVALRDAGLLVKRINIRRHQPFPGTPLAMDGERTSGRILNRFEFYRSKIRQEVDTYMLREIYPAGTVIRDILVLDHHEGHSLGKQISSYSITARIALQLPPHSFCVGVVVGHRERSLLVLPVPSTSIP